MIVKYDRSSQQSTFYIERTLFLVLNNKRAVICSTIDGLLVNACEERCYRVVLEYELNDNHDDQSIPLLGARGPEVRFVNRLWCSDGGWAGATAGLLGGGFGPKEGEHSFPNGKRSTPVSWISSSVEIEL